ncbi:hypothetical protein VFPPC_06583 [Pochonia chlamydosporia 170]|uniref:Uncharacterized protein n=1 Tax=Pochonia chlamydosporia 170 TaxID=1380566 RepID=A0A179F4U4_METCM|nr:hypothetical protein VFPPC_06583 [Pochonia chlamydosporia 170]OAQ60444.1 hypothetical protein VFPPC_06583 [Pochonia chlamydosporia 170]
MKANSFSFIALRILLLAITSTAQPPPTIQCPSLPPDQPVSRIQCENHDGSVVEVSGPRPFNCKLSWVAIRAQTTKTTTHEQQEPLNEERGQCALWLFQFSDDGLVQQSCCGEAGEGLVIRVSRVQDQHDEDWEPAQEWMEFHEGVEEPVQHLQMDDAPVGGDGVEQHDDEDGDEHGDADEDGYEDEYEDDYEDEDGDIEFGTGQQHIFEVD